MKNTAESETMETTESVRVEIPEEDILRLQNLEMARLSFEKRLRQDIEDDENTEFKIIDNVSAEYNIDSGLGYPIRLATVKWDLLGIYHPGSEEGMWNWTWAWGLIPPPEKSRPEIVMQVIRETLKEFAVYDSISVRDAMLISYIHARLLDTFKYQYIHVQDNGNGSFTAFGVRDARWELYDPEAHKAQLYYATLSGVPGIRI